MRAARVGMSPRLGGPPRPRRGLDVDVGSDASEHSGRTAPDYPPPPSCTHPHAAGESETNGRGVRHTQVLQRGLDVSTLAEGLPAPWMVTFRLQKDRDARRLTERRTRAWRGPWRPPGGGGGRVSHWGPGRPRPTAGSRGDEASGASITVCLFIYSAGASLPTTS